MPSGWAWANLADIADVVRQQVTPSEQPDKAFNYLSIENVEPNTGRLVNFSPTSGGEILSGKLAFTTQDVLYSRLRPYLNKVHLPTFDGISATDLLPIRPKQGVSREFLAYYLRTRSVVEYAKQRMRGIQLPRLAVEDLLSIRIPVPPSKEQERIADKIKKLHQDLRTAKLAVQRVPLLMRQFRQSVWAKAFRGELAAHDSADGHFSKPLELTDSGSGNKPRDTPTLHPYPLPKNWAWTSFGREIEGTLYGPRFGKDEYTTMGTMTIRTTDMDDFGNIILKDPPRVKLNQKQKENFGLKSGDILITRSGSIGKCAIFEGVDQSAIPSAYIIRVRLMAKRVDPRYALYYLLSPDGQRLLGTGSHAITQQNINAEVIKKFPFPLAPIGEQIRIAAKIQELFAHSDEVESTVLEGMGKIREIEQASLAKAFRGELVPQDPSDEPAAILLDRIKSEGIERVSSAQKLMSRGRSR